MLAPSSAFSSHGAISLRTGIFTAIPGIMAGPIFTALFYGSRELMESGYIVASVRLP